MRLPSFKRLFSGDYQKEFQKLIDTLSLSINNGIEVIIEALNGNLTLRDNMKCTIKDVTVTVDSTGKPINTTSFTLNSNSRIDGAICILATNQTVSSHYPTSGIFISGSQASQSYIINNIAGIQANEKYVLRIAVYQQ